MYKQNTIEGDIFHIYKEYEAKKNSLISKIQFPISNYAYGKIYIDIEELLTIENTGFPFNNSYFGMLTILGNIEGSQGNGLFWKSQEIRDHFLSIANSHISLLSLKDHLLNEIELKYGSEQYSKVCHASISHKASN